MSTTPTLPSGFDQAREMLMAHDERAALQPSARDRHDREHTQEELLFAHLRDMVLNGQAAMWFLMTPRVIERQLDYEVEVDLTREERSRVVDDVMNSPAIDEMMETLNAEFRDVVRRIVQHHIGKRQP